MKKYINMNLPFVLPLKMENNMLDTQKINYNMTNTHVFPYSYFGFDFNYDKMREYAKLNGWDENDIGFYKIRTWEKEFPQYIKSNL